MSRGKKIKTVFIQMKVEPKWKERVMKRALDCDKSLTGYIENLINADLEQAEKSDLTNKPK